MSIGPRNFMVSSQLYIDLAPGADPQAVARQAVTAINGALSALTAPFGVSFAAEYANGAFVIDGQDRAIAAWLLVEQATDMADAQASVEQAVTAIRSELSGLAAPSVVTFEAEEESGAYVFAEPG